MTLTEELEGTGAEVVYINDIAVKIDTVVNVTSYTNFHACLAILENYAADNSYSNDLDLSLGSNSFKATIYKQEDENGQPVK